MVLGNSIVYLLKGYCAQSPSPNIRFHQPPNMKFSQYGTLDGECKGAGGVVDKGDYG